MKQITKKVLYLALLYFVIIIATIIFTSWIESLTPLPAGVLRDCSIFHEITGIFIPILFKDIIIILMQVAADWFQIGENKKWKNNVSAAITIMSALIFIIIAAQLIYSFFEYSHEASVNIGIFIALFFTIACVGIIEKNLMNVQSEDNSEKDKIQAENNSETDEITKEE